MTFNFTKIFNFKKSILAKIFVVFTLLILFIFLLITSIWNKNVNNLIFNSAVLHIVDISKNINISLEKELTEINDIIQIIGEDETVRYNVANYEETNEIENYLNSFMLLKSKSIYGIAVADMEGNIYKTGSPYLPAQYLERDWVQSIINANGDGVFTLKNIHTSTNIIDSEKPTYITVGRAIMDKNKTIGFVIIDVKPQVIINSFSVNAMNGMATTILVDQQKRLIFSNNYEVTDSDISNFVDRVNSVKDFTPLYCKINKSPYIMIGYKSVFTNWTSIILVKKTWLQKDYIKAIKQTIISAILVFILSLFLSMIISNNLTKKIRNLSDAITAFDNGTLRLDEDINPVKSDDEIGELSSAFSQLLSTIDYQFKNISVLEEQKRTSEIKALEAQINPHFLYNTLNTIKYLAEIQNIDNISNITNTLINILKYSVSNPCKYVPIKEEVEYIKNYLYIQQYKYLNEIEVIYDISEEILNCLTIKMILQPIVENSLKHGLHSSEKGQIIIKGYRMGDKIEIKIIDNGTGIAHDKIKELLLSSPGKESKIGLQNVNERIKLFFGPAYGLDIFSIEGVQTIISINIPALSEEDIRNDI